MVLGTTVNCLAVWIDGVLLNFACPEVMVPLRYQIDV